MPDTHQHVNRGVAVVQSETTEGTDAIDTILQTGTGSLDYQSFQTMEITPITQIREYDAIRPAFSGLPHALIRDHMAVTIEGYLNGAENPGNAGGEAPHYAAVLKAAGLSETISSGVSATYKPDSAMGTPMSAYRLWTNTTQTAGALRLAYALGVRGNLNVNLVAGEFARFTFEGLGANFPESSDTAAFKGYSDDLSFLNGGNGRIDLDKTGSAVTLSGVEYDDAGRFVVRSVALTIDSVTFPLASLNLNTNMQPQPSNTMNGSQLARQIILAPQGRAGGNMELNETGTAFEKVLTLALNASEVSATAVMDNGTDQLTLTIPKLQVGYPTPTDNGGIRAWTVGYFCNGDYASSVMGDNEYTWLYEAAP